MSPKLKQLTKEQEAHVKRPWKGHKVEFLDIYESESGVLFVDYMVTVKNQWVKHRTHRVCVFAKTNGKTPPICDHIVSDSVIKLWKRKDK